MQMHFIEGVSSQRRSRFGRATRSPAMFVRSHRSLCSLAPQPSASLRSVHGLAHSLCSLPRGTVEILEYVFTLLSRFTGTNAFLALTRNTPIVYQEEVGPDKQETGKKRPLKVSIGICPFVVRPRIVFSFDESSSPRQRSASCSIPTWN